MKLSSQKITTLSVVAALTSFMAGVPTSSQAIECQCPAIGGLNLLEQILTKQVVKIRNHDWNVKSTNFPSGFKFDEKQKYSTHLKLHYPKVHTHHRVETVECYYDVDKGGFGPQKIGDFGIETQCEG